MLNVDVYFFLIIFRLVFIINKKILYDFTEPWNEFLTLLPAKSLT